MSDIHAEKILVLDFGSQTTQLIARRVREARVYCEIHPCTMPLRAVKAFAPRGIILSGGPCSVYEPDAPTMDPGVLELGVPVLGICYGMQTITRLLGGEVARGTRREYGPALIEVKAQAGLFRDLPPAELQKVWMSHGDRIEKLPEGFTVLARSDNSPVAAMGDPARRLYGVQFHPEVVHTPQGAAMLAAFVLGECGCRPDWTMHNFAQATIARFKETLAGRKVICALSGGVDSSVVAVLLHKAIGRDLTAIFVDNGLLRQDEVIEVAGLFRQTFGLNLVVVDAAERFLTRLKGVREPEHKRKIIGHAFIEIFEAEAQKIGRVDYLAQGTLYPDVIESVSFRGPSATIKTHHNVGGLPDRMRMQLVEPLRELFKDECREVGRELGLPESIVGRQPFPGPGLAIRILGEVTAGRLATLRAADAVVKEEMLAADLYDKVWQSFAVLLPVKTVGVMGDGRTYEDVIALRVVDSVDAMTADWSRLPYEVLARISSRIINEVAGVTGGVRYHLKTPRHHRVGVVVAKEQFKMRYHVSKYGEVISRDTRESLALRYHTVTSTVNREFWGIQSETEHSLLVGSYGRGTAVSTSDIDILIELPQNEYLRYDSVKGNGQSRLLQAVRSAVQTTYSRSDIRADGQVVKIAFSDGMRFEILPAFRQDNRFDQTIYTYPDTNMGGNWRSTNPQAEQTTMKQKNAESNGLFFDTCKHFRCVRDENFNNYHLSGIVIDSFVYAAMGGWHWTGEGDSSSAAQGDYEQALLDYFANNNSYWSPLRLTAPGSGQTVDTASSISCLEKVLSYIAE